MKKKTNLLFQTFSGEYVNMLTKLTLERSVQNGELIETMKTPVAIQGFLIEADDENFYLGISPGLINQAVRIDEVVHIEVTQEESGLMEELLQNGEVPPGDQFN